MNSQEVQTGRIQNLTKEQELKLKQAWTHLFKFWGVEVDGSFVFDYEGSAQASSESVKSFSSVSKRKKLLGMFGRKREGRLDSSALRNSDCKEGSAVSTVRLNDSTDEEYFNPLNYELLKDLDSEEVRDKFWNMLRCDYPDNLVLRFMRARNWDTNKAMVMIMNTLRWRLKESHPDEIVRKGEIAYYNEGREGMIKQIELMKATVRGFDKVGNPIVYVRPRLHYSSDQTEKDVQDYSLLIIEQARLFIQEPVEAATIIFDMTKFSMANMDYGPVKFLISCFQTHYPECLAKLFIHNAPWIFPPIWNIIKNWLDPVVASKVIFSKSAKDFEEYISLEHIPKHLGGKDDYDYDNYIKPADLIQENLKDEKAKEFFIEERRLLVEEFIAATVSWIESTTDEMSLKWLNKKRELSKKLSINYANLDPYIRSRSIYDINGTLKIQVSCN